jgi:acetyl-CoA acetyltransferase
MRDAVIVDAVRTPIGKGKATLLTGPGRQIGAS